MLILAVLLIGPKDIPKLAQQIGRWVAQFKNAIQDLKDTVQKEVNLHEENSSESKNGDDR